METKVIVMFAVLHGSAIVLCAGLVIMLARSTPDPSSGAGGGPGGGEDPLIPPSPGAPGGGLLLSDSRPARVRLREPIQPGALWRRPARRAHPGVDPRPAPEKRPLRVGGGDER